MLEEDQKVHLAINRMGLATLSPFNPKYVRAYVGTDISFIIARIPVRGGGGSGYYIGWG